MTRISRVLGLVSAGLFFCLSARSDQSVSLSWAAGGSAAAGYILYYGTASHNYTSQVNVGTNTVVTLSGLQSGQTYYFAVAAYNSSGMDSPLSNEASFVAPTNNPVATASGVIVCPASATVGAAVCIYGANISAASSVSFNGVAASFTMVSNVYLTAIVPVGATSGTLSVAAASGTITLPFTVTATSGPANDKLSNAQILTGTAAFVSENTTGATKQPYEPNHGGNAGGASVWYSWTAPTTGTFVLDTTGTSFTPLLAVYTGMPVSQLAVVASNLAPAVGPLSFEATAGVTYQIAVDGYNGASGDMQLRLSPALAASTIFADDFETSEGVVAGLPLSGQNGWQCSVPALSGVIANYFAGYGQQGYLGFTALTLTNNTVLLTHPMNYTVSLDRPIVQFSALVQLYNPLNIFHDSFGWLVRNASGQELFDVTFNEGTGLVNYGLNDGAGERSSGFPFSVGLFSQLIVTMDFSRNQWEATLNGEIVIAGQPMTTTQAALTFGEIDIEGIYSGLKSGSDGMVFDNFTVTAEPEPQPGIILGPQNQTVTAGSDLVEGVIAAGAPPLSYQWYSNGVPIMGATNNTLWLSNATPAMSGNYEIVVSSVNGSADTGCTVTVANPHPKVFLAGPSSTNFSGRTLNFNVASGNSYHVQASTNLINWSAIGSFYSSGTNATFLDTAASAFPKRFYRLASP